MYKIDINKNNECGIFCLIFHRIYSAQLGPFTIQATAYSMTRKILPVQLAMFSTKNTHSK